MALRFLSQTLDKLVLRTKLFWLREHPSPAMVCGVVQCCLRLGKFEDAFGHAAEGLRQSSSNDSNKPTTPTLGVGMIPSSSVSL